MDGDRLYAGDSPPNSSMLENKLHDYLDMLTLFIYDKRCYFPLWNKCRLYHLDPSVFPPLRWLGGPARVMTRRASRTRQQFGISPNLCRRLGGTLPMQPRGLSQPALVPSPCG